MRFSNFFIKRFGEDIFFGSNKFCFKKYSCLSSFSTIEKFSLGRLLPLLEEATSIYVVNYFFLKQEYKIET